MKGKARCNFQSKAKKDLQFENVLLTVVSEERVAIIASPDLNEPEELLTIECVHITILASSHMELEGFASLEEHNQTFIRCSVEFFPVIESEKEAA